MVHIPLRRRADPSQRDVDYHYIDIDNEDIEESPEALWWYTDETAGGMSLPITFDGIPAGTKLNEIKAYFLEKLYRNYATQPDDELGEAIHTFYNGLGEYMVEDYNWRRVVVPFGCTYRGKAMNQVLDKKWMEWVRYSDRCAASRRRYPLFFRALDRWLATPRHYIATRDIGESTSAPYDEEEIARQNLRGGGLTDSDAESEDVLDDNGYSLKDGFVEPDDRISEESEEEVLEDEELESMSDVMREQIEEGSEDETSADDTEVSTNHYETDATSEAESEGKLGQRGYKIGGFVEDDGSNAIDSDDYDAGGEADVETDEGDDSNSESSSEQPQPIPPQHGTPVSSRTRSHARSRSPNESPNVSSTTEDESSEDDSPSSSRTSTPCRRPERLQRIRKSRAHAAKSNSDVEMDSEMKQISDSDAEDIDFPQTPSDTTAPVSSRLRFTAPKSTSSSATAVENRSCSPQKHLALLQPSDFEDLPQETLVVRTRTRSKPGHVNSTPPRRKRSPPVSSRTRSSTGARENRHGFDAVAESSSSRSLPPPSSRTRSRTKHTTPSATAAGQSGRPSTPSSASDRIVPDSSDSEEIVPSSDTEYPPITPSPNKRKRRSTTVYSSSSSVETEDESLPMRSPLKRSRMRVDSESDVSVVAESPSHGRKVKVVVGAILLV
ncbi:hypothetical protein PQX77_004110 [Marasmius sp. AFHP31]|nr:hypothetical protein PQX77_004110 [Marasmius sp. AFHP31]